MNVMLVTSAESVIGATNNLPEVLNGSPEVTVEVADAVVVSSVEVFCIVLVGTDVVSPLVVSEDGTVIAVVAVEVVLTLVSVLVTAIVLVDWAVAAVATAVPWFSVVSPKLASWLFIEETLE